MAENEMEIPQVRNMSLIERSEAQLRTAMQSEDHMLRWAEASGRTYLVLKTSDVIKAMANPWPDGIRALVHMVQAYRDYRATIETGRYEKQKDPRTKQMVEIPIMKTDELELEELDRAMRFLYGKITKIDPNWSLENPPL